MKLRFGFVLAPLVFSLGCSSDSPAGPDAQIASPAPVVAATAAPTASPTPSNRCPNGQTRVATFETRVFSVLDKNGELRHYEQGGVLYVGETFRLDSQGKDVNRQRTNGCDPDGPRWDWDRDDLAMLNGTSGWNPKGKVLAAGKFTINANLNFVEAAPLVLTFEDAPEETPQQ